MRFPRRAAVLALALSTSATITAACGSFGSQDSGSSGSSGSANSSGSAAGDAAESGPGSVACEGADLRTSAQHCGKCGHDCVGGSCIGGECQAFELATFAAKKIVGIATDSSRVVWSDGSNLFRCAKTGCGGMAVQATTTNLAPNALASNPTGVFVVAGGGVNGRFGQLALDDGYAVVADVAPGYPFLVASHEGRPYAVNDGNTPTNAGLWGPNAGGSAIERIGSFTVADETTHRNWAALTATTSRVFAADYAQIHACTLPTCLDGWTVFAGGAGPTAIGVVGLAATTSDVYWTSSVAAGLYSCPTATAGPCGKPATIGGLPTSGAPGQLVLSAGRLHVAVGTKLVSCAPESCSGSWLEHAEDPRLIKDGIGRQLFTADERAVYWVSADPLSPAPSGDAGNDASTDAAVTPPPTRTFHIMKRAK